MINSAGLENKITICVPTFNRRTHVVELVKSLISQGILKKINLFVIDDGSCDGTYHALKEINYPALSDVRIEFQENQGLALTFIRFFRDAKSKYIMFLPDDDMINGNELDKIRLFVEKEQVDYISSAWLDSDGKTLFRGRKSVSKIDIKDIRASCDHAPGLFYRVELFKGALNMLSEKINDGSYVSKMFPQTTLLLYHTLYSDNIWWHPAKVGGFVKNIGAQKSQLFDNDNNHWSSLVGRWKEQLGFAEIYADLISKTDNQYKLKKVCAIAG